jgi:long-chain acyl-CoA synthetase
MHPSVHAQTNPDKPAIIVAETGAVCTYGQLDAASNKVAQFFRSRGLKHDDVVAIMLDNDPDYYSLTWGAQRSGLRYVCISSRLTQDETDYILDNSGAKLFIMSASLAATAAQLMTQLERYALGGDLPGYQNWQAAIAPMPDTPIAGERAGVDMLYSRAPPDDQRAFAFRSPRTEASPPPTRW